MSGSSLTYPPMAEFRTDWLTGRAVFIAENRANRPNEFAEHIGETSEAGSPTTTTCPFCPGNESITPPAVYEQRDGDGRWRIRAVPNKFPAVTLGDCPHFSPTSEPERQRNEREKGPVPFGLASPSACPAFGVQEVIIETPRHVSRTSALSVQELHSVLKAYAERLDHWHEDGEFSYGLVFKNQGPRAGASLAHLHSQLIALPAVPPAVRAELDRADEDYRRHRDCPYCRLIQQERAAAERIVADDGGIIAFCPFASLQPYEIWCLPTDHEPLFERPPRCHNLDPLAMVLHDLIRRVESIVPEAAYNLLLRTGPWVHGYNHCCHWRIEILPRTTAFAGLELATGTHINPLPPERAAHQLREFQ